MAQYRRKKVRDTWHWCRNCTNDSKIDYDTRDKRPDYDLRNECKGKENSGNCAT